MAIPATLDQVPDAPPYAQYIATPGQTQFPYPFPITQDADLVLVIDGVTQPTDVGYSVSGVGNATGGYVTTSPQSGGTVLTVYRDVPIERITQFATNGGFSSIAFNAEFNNIYLILQQLSNQMAFALQIPYSNTPAPVTTLQPGAYANAYLGFDANGNPQAVQLTSSGPITFQILAPILGFVATPEEIAAGVDSYITDFVRDPGDFQRYGVVGDNSTDDTVALNRIGTASWGSNITFFCSAGLLFKTTDTVTFAGPHCAVMMDPGSSIEYAGPVDRACLVIGSDAQQIQSRDFNLSAHFHGNANDYSDINCVGIQIRGCFIGNRVRLNSTAGFTVNWQLLGTNDSGITYNTFDLGISTNAYTHLDIHGVSSNGFINENLFLNGDFQTNSNYVPGAAGSVRGIIFRADPGGYTDQNKNQFIKPCFQLTSVGVAGARLPINFFNSGSENQFFNCRFEGYNGPLVTVTASTVVVRNNLIDIGYFSTAYGTLQGLMSETDGGFSYGNRISRYGSLLSDRVSSGDLIARAFVASAGNVGVTGLFMQAAASGSTTAFGLGLLGKDYVLLNSSGLGTFVDTTYYKNFEVRADTLAGKEGRITIVAFDSSNTIISSTRAVQFGGLSENSNFGGHSYTLGSDGTGVLVFRVDSNVDHIKVIFVPGTAGCWVRSFSITGFASDTENTGANSGLAVYGGNKAYKNILMGAIPTKLGPVYSNRGDVINNTAAAASGVVMGWQCTLSGHNAPDWAISTAYVLNQIVNHDTGKIYVCRAAGTSAGAGGPTGTGTGISDGTVTWDYVETGVATWTTMPVNA